MKFTKEKIAEYKAKYGELSLLEVEGFSCILHAPTRKNVSYAAIVKDPIKMSEVMLNELWVDGDSEIKERDDLFLAVSNKMDELLKLKEVAIKKL